MKYRESSKDKKLRAWFQNDNTRQLLRRIQLIRGFMRGLNRLDLEFEFPITAIAGKNGSGKSTILAIACCAYHNSKNGFKLPKRKLSYYTFSDFFVQHSEETPPSGILIRYDIAHNRWRKTEAFPDGIGLGYQYRKKVKGGKWNDYHKRVSRNVIFLGIERIVPHSERSQSKSYSKVFRSSAPKGWEDKARKAVGYILDKQYEDFRYLEYSKYTLPIVKIDGNTISGFNMGAGENALFEIFSTIYSCGDGALLVMDEIELGLHVGAQRKFIDKLKDACLEMHSQVICTTHSKDIFDCLPLDARYFLECVNGKSKLISAIGSEFAFAKMGNKGVKELEILVEDDVAESLLLGALSAEIRTRIKIRIIGSASAIARQLAAIYIRDKSFLVLAVYDGDQKLNKSNNFNHAKAMAETSDSEFETWYNERHLFIPGDLWPESWIIEKCRTHTIELASVFGTDEDTLVDALECGNQAGKHAELKEIAQTFGMDRSECMGLVTNLIGRREVAEFQHIIDKISKELK